MYATSSLISGQIAYERQRDMLAHASRHRLAREARRATIAVRRARRTNTWALRARPAARQLRPAATAGSN